jgi:hypothetical protein
MPVSIYQSTWHNSPADWNFFLESSVGVTSAPAARLQEVPASPMSDMQDFKVLFSRTFLWFRKENIAKCMGSVQICLVLGLVSISTPV